MSSFLKKSVLITGMTISNSALGFLIQLILARQFGVGEELDLYFYYLSYPTFVASLFASVFSYSLLPIISRVHSEVERASIQSSLLWSLIAPILVVILIFLFIISTNVMLIIYDFAFYMLVLGIGVGLMQVLQALILTLLNASERQTLSAFLLVIPYVCMLLGALLIQVFGLLVVPLSLFLGTLLSFIIGCYQVRDGIKLTFDFKVIYTLFGKGAIVALGMTCFSSYSIVDAYWATSAGEGVLTTMNYSQRLLIAIGNLVVVAPSVLLIPRISILLVDAEYYKVKTYISRSIVYFVLMNLTLWCLFYFLSGVVIEALFKGGRFSEANVNVLVETVHLMLPGVFFMLTSVMLFRILFCLPNVEVIGAVIGLGWTVLYFSFSSIYYIDSSKGIALAYSYSWSILVVILTIVVFRCYKEYFINERK